MKKNAFTLAEVLITLGIIGVVAAMTLPTLIQNHQKQVYVNGLKKALSISQNMIKQMQADEGVSDFGSTHLFSDGVCVFADSTCEDSYGNPSVFEEVIPKYLKAVKTCKGEACTQKVYHASFWCDENNKCKNEIARGSTPIPLIAAYIHNLTGFYTADGMIFYFFPHGLVVNNDYRHGKAVGVMVDVNGDKGPNIENVDLFIFAIDKNGKLGSIPYETDHFDAIKHLMSNGWKMDY